VLQDHTKGPIEVLFCFTDLTVDDCSIKEVGSKRKKKGIGRVGGKANVMEGRRPPPLTRMYR
jgi:hypothetical protein